MERASRTPLLKRATQTWLASVLLFPFVLVALLDVSPIRPLVSTYTLAGDTADVQAHYYYPPATQTRHLEDIIPLIVSL